ncbi:MAG: M28 family metallopeptidase, partial [bacterium]
YYVAFQVEELGLIGSAAFVDSIVTDSIDQEVFAVLNTDMLGYNAVADQLDVVTNQTSEWFADWIVETSTEFLVDLPVEKLVRIFGRSDHASFWNAGIDGVLLFEDINLPYPEYHTYQDLWENTFPPSGRPNPEKQFERAAQLAVATLARFALHYEAPDLAIPTGEIAARPASGQLLEAGRDVVLQARVHNFGTSDLVFESSTVESLTARVQFFDGEPSGGALVAETTRKTFFASGGVEVIEAIWETAAGQEGYHEIHAVVEGLDPGYAQVEVERGNNSASFEVFLRGTPESGPRAVVQYAYPNPVRGDVSSMSFYYELTNPADVLIEVFDLEGTFVGRYAALLPIIDDGNQPGANVVSGSLFRSPSGERLSLDSGVYLYVLQLSNASDQVTDRQKGKFAVVR